MITCHKSGIIGIKRKIEIYLNYAYNFIIILELTDWKEIDLLTTLNIIVAIFRNTVIRESV
jgi:hypothetical protein